MTPQTVSDEIILKMKQYFKENFIYICLAAACLSLVGYFLRINIKFGVNNSIKNLPKHFA